MKSLFYSFCLLAFWVSFITESEAQKREQTSWDILFEEYGLVDVQKLDSSIIVHLMYSTPNNFMECDVYGDFNRAYLAPKIAQKIIRAQQILSQEHPNWSIIIYDAARPLSIQKRMWNSVKNTPKQMYVNPVRNGRGGRHNYGVAVDLSLYDCISNTPIDMGTEVDHFGKEAHNDRLNDLVQNGLISSEAKKNRTYLFGLMKRVRLIAIRTEWWHFQEPNNISDVRSEYKLLDF